MKAGEKELESDTAPEPKRYTQEEVLEALEALNDAQLISLRNISVYLANGAGIDPEELRQEAFCRILTTRSCSVEVDIVRYVAGVMRSIASEGVRARKKEAVENIVFLPLAANDRVDPASPDPTPEDEAYAATHYRECLARIADLVADDEELQFLVEGLCDGLRGSELEELLETDTKGLAAARKRLSRHLAKAFPGGVPV